MKRAGAALAGLAALAVALSGCALEVSAERWSVADACERRERWLEVVERGLTGGASWDERRGYLEQFRDRAMAVQHEELTAIAAELIATDADAEAAWTDMQEGDAAAEERWDAAWDRLEQVDVRARRICDRA